MEPLVLNEATLIALLRNFVAIPTVSASVRLCVHDVCSICCVGADALCLSGQLQFRPHCLQGAKFVQELLRAIGAEEQLIEVRLSSFALSSCCRERHSVREHGADPGP